MDEMEKRRKNAYSHVLRQLMEEYGYSTSSFAKKAKIDQRTLRKALNTSEGMPNNIVQEKNAAAFRMSLKAFNELVDAKIQEATCKSDITGGKKIIESTIYFKQMISSLDNIAQVGDGDVLLTSLQITHDRKKFPALTNLQQHTIKIIKNSPNVNFSRLVRLTETQSSKYKYLYIRDFIYMMEGHKNISMKFFGILDEKNKSIIDIAPYSLSSSIQVINCGNGQQEGFVFTLHPDSLFNQATTRCNYYNGKSESDGMVISQLIDLYGHTWDNSVYLLESGRITKQWKIIEEIFNSEKYF